MPITEQQRRQVFDSLESAHGPDIASTIMEMLPRHSNDELATRADINALGTALRGEMAELRASLREEILDAKISTQRWMAAAMAANSVALVTALLT